MLNTIAGNLSIYKTSGERLLEFLRSDLLEELHAPDLTSKVIHASMPVARGDNFAVALQDLISINVLQRLLLSSRWVVKKYCTDMTSDEENDALVSRQLREMIRNEFRVNSSVAVTMYNHVVAATSASRQKLTRSMRQEVFREHGLVCFSCGIALERRSEGSDQATVDHLWPRSLGGDTNFNNLLPACKGCNNYKNDSSVWSSFWFQNLFFGPHPSQHSIETKLGIRMIVALQFYRAYTVTRQRQISLKEALLLIGPIELPDLDDREFSSDFFTVF